MSAIQRLLSHVDRLPLDENGCKPWDGAKARDGYGVTTLRENGERLPGTSRVHRRVLEAHLGRTLARDELACHSCDVPICVNITHLWAGSASDNVQDSIRKGRTDPVAAGRRMKALGKQVRGDEHGRRKLSSQDVMAIRSLRAEGWRNCEVADLFMVSRAEITLITQGKKWAHLLSANGGA